MKSFVFALLFFIFFFVENLHGEVSLVGSPESLAKQNMMADREGLVRIKNDTMLEEMKREGKLVAIPSTVRIDKRLDPKWHWVLPRVADFLESLPIDFINQFGRFFQVNSAVRTVPRQLELIKIGNQNANLPLVGPRMPPHLTGATIDIAKLGLSKNELEWLRRRLLELEELDLIEATEEKLQAVFHVMVFETYSSAQKSWGTN